MVIAIKTDSDPTELYLVDDKNNTGSIVVDKSWSANRALARNLLGEIEKITGKDFGILSGIIVYEGPGSFTGLRIGITTANTMSYALNLPIVGSTGSKWLKRGLIRLRDNENDRIVLPKYGSEAHITAPKK